MLKESASRAAAADILQESGDTSDSAYILRLLAFELLLKLLVEEQTGETAPKHHRYAEIFGLLPASIQSRFSELAGERIGPSALANGLERILEELGSNFVQLRYPYDKYTDLKEEQYARLGASWLVGGAPAEQSTFRYYPEELFGLIHAAKSLAGG